MYSYFYMQFVMWYCIVGVFDGVLCCVVKWFVEKVGEDVFDFIGESFIWFCVDFYEFMFEVWGYGFVYVDVIGGELGIVKGVLCCLVVLVYYMLKIVIEGDGYIFLLLDVFSDCVYCIDFCVDVWIVLNYVFQKGYLIVVDDKCCCYLDCFCVMEGVVVEMFVMLLLLV